MKRYMNLKCLTFIAAMTLIGAAIQTNSELIKELAIILMMISNLTFVLEFIESDPNIRKYKKYDTDHVG